MKEFRTLLLLGAILLQPLWAAEATAVPGKAAQSLSLFRKKSISVKSHSAPGLFGYSEIPSAIQTVGADSAELRRFLQQTCGTGKTRELSGTDKILGTLGTMAS